MLIFIVVPLWYVILHRDGNRLKKQLMVEQSVTSREDRYVQINQNSTSVWLILKLLSE